MKNMYPQPTISWKLLGQYQSYNLVTKTAFYVLMRNCKLVSTKVATCKTKAPK